MNTRTRKRVSTAAPHPAKRGRHRLGAASALAVTLLSLSACSSGSPGTGPGNAARTPFSPSGLTKPARSPRCPLTGTAAPGGLAPDHPAVAVKVENLPSARPQYGLNAADLIYEEPVEAGITRFLAVFQCHEESRIEPVRSSRLVDASLLPQLGKPVFGFAGGIGPSLAAVKASGARLVDDITNPQPFTLDPARAAPHNLVTSTSALLAAAGNPIGAPKALFTYSAKPPAGAAAPAIHLAFSYAADVWWRWNPKAGRYLRFYGTVPARLGDGAQIQTANVVVEQVRVVPSPYVEDANGVHENYIGAVGTGPAEVARNGVVITGTWVHPHPGSPTRLLDSEGQLISLARGPTWVELLPTTSPATPPL
ncbi:MAG: DUF3048 domain-containing protein [Acidimicrobiales bacterium]